MEAIRVEKLNFSYPGQNKKVLNSINFSVFEGEFIVLCGESGCGKSTLLRQLKPELTPAGDINGEIFYYGKELDKCDPKETSYEIGYVLQNPDSQIVTDKVWHELAFGLENMGIDTQTIRRRVAEMASFFGIQNWFRKDISELSGGQKQLLNLASIMVMQPKVLILDEPTSQLDPIASRDFIDTLVRLNKELGITIIITEHNLEELFALADKIIVMDENRILCMDTPSNVVKILSNNSHEFKMFKALPTASRIYNELKDISLHDELYPITVKEGRNWINRNIDFKKFIDLDNKVTKDKQFSREIVISMKDVWFQYEKGLEPVLRNISLDVFKGEIYSILGGNGTGKTTTLSVLSKQKRALRGKVLINNIDINKYKNSTLYNENLALLPQNPQSLFVFSTVKEDLEEIFFNKKYNKLEVEEKVQNVAKLFNITDLLNHHPYDLSGGEIQRAALAKIMLLNPKILLLDEPTKGLDAYSKEEIGETLLKLKSSGITIVIVTHDIEFSANYSDRCAMFFDGSIVSEGEPREFYGGNSFYTTAANRMVKDISKNAVTYKDVVNLCRLNANISLNL